jgi:hypothetical protein
MEVKNAEIKEASIRCRGVFVLYAKVMFKTEDNSYVWNASLENYENTRGLETLMYYANAEDCNQMQGESVRIVLKDENICGFGDPNKDSFVVIFKDDIIWTTESELEKLLKDSKSNDSQEG